MSLAGQLLRSGLFGTERRLHSEGSELAIALFIVIPIVVIAFVAMLMFRGSSWDDDQVPSISPKPGSLLSSQDTLSGSPTPSHAGSEHSSAAPRRMPPPPAEPASVASRQKSQEAGPLQNASQSLLSLFYDNAKEHGTERVDARGSMFQGVVDHSVLCPELVVQQRAGQTLELNGMLEPYQQEGVVELCSVELKSGESKEVVLNAFMSESDPNGGVLLENSLQQPVAFMRTSCAVGPKGASRPASAIGRHVPIIRTRYAGNPTSPPFAIVHAGEEGHAGDVVYHFIMRYCTSGGEPGPVLLHIHQNMSRVLNITDADGALLATSKENDANVPCTTRGRSTARTLQVRCGADASLVVCAIIAASKL